MSNATNEALRGFPFSSAGWSEVGRDLVNGAWAVARTVVVLVGCVSLLVTATLLASGEARGRLVERVVEVVVTLPQTALAFAQRGIELRSVANMVEVEVAVVPVAAEPQQKFVTQYLARRYRVADEAVRRIVAAAYESGRSLGLDPLLILAVTAIESSMNPFAESAMGAQGLMQVMTRVHADKFEVHGGDHAALDPVANLRVGSTILKDLVQRGGSVERGLQLYVGAGNLPDDGGYAARVLAEHGRLATAAAGRVERAIAAGRSPVAAAEVKPGPGEVAGSKGMTTEAKPIVPVSDTGHGRPEPSDAAT